MVFLYNHLDGAMPKWSKGMVCKTIIRGFESRSHLQFDEKKDASRRPFFSPGGYGALLNAPFEIEPLTTLTVGASKSAAIVFT